VNGQRHYRPAARRDAVDRLRAAKRIIEYCVGKWTTTSVNFDKPMVIDGRRHWWRKAEPAELPENRAAAWLELSRLLREASRQLTGLAIDAEARGKNIIRIELEETQHGNQPTH
jgi:hypothetical protein